MNQKRQPAGIPIGGEFAENSHDEATGMLYGGASAFERIDVGDSMVLSQDMQPDGTTAQTASLFRDYDSRVVLVTEYEPPLTGDVVAGVWVSDHADEYETFLAREYGAEYNRRTGRVVIETTVDEDEGVPERDLIDRAFGDDNTRHYEREVANGEFSRRLHEIISADSISDEGERATVAAATKAAEDYYAGNASEIETSVARTLAREFTRGTGSLYPNLQGFVWKGVGSLSSMRNELDRIDNRRHHIGDDAFSPEQNARYVALMGFLYRDQS